jgi:cobalt-zinc-cadmium efflux system protein
MAARHHAHQQATRDFGRAFAVGIGLNTAYVAVEAYLGWQAGSLALLADAGHNLSDIAGLALAWVGAIAARLAPDERHTYGWRRASILAAFANSILLLVAMGSLAWEAVGRLHAPQATQGWTIIVVAGAGVLVNGATAAMFMRGRAADLNVRGAFVHMAADALVSIGVVATGLLYLWTGWTWLDPVASLAIAGVIVVGSWGLLRQSVHYMFDGVPDSVDLGAVRAMLLSRPGVSDVHDLHVWAMSASEIAISAHLVMPQGHPGDEFFAGLGRELHDRFHIGHPTLQVEIDCRGHACGLQRPPGHE